MRLFGKQTLWIPLAFLAVSSSLPAGERGLFGWFSSKEDAFPGGRKHYHGGREWPIAPRPEGPEESLVQKFHDNLYWPDPYTWQERALVRGRLCTQANAGWVAATTLTDQHFDSETHELNLAGRTQLRWILMHTPTSRRQAYVQTTLEEGGSQTRLMSVQQHASLLVGANNVPPIMLRNCLPIGGSGQEADIIRRNFLSSAPTPRLTPATQTGSSTTSTSTDSASSSSPAYLSPSYNAAVDPSDTVRISGANRPVPAPQR